MSARITVALVGGEPRASCRCDAPAEVVEVQGLCSVEPEYIAGALTEPCRCPRCFSCKHTLDNEGRCENLDCLNLGLHIPIPG